ncbi:MAG: 16S rRNA (cytidine(1402)-2'-O)-methyltransferase [Actinomycetota bacterium]|nr:16S rRNA (cytidine(1402)-2'-O)-methyltransferase [Actinomycetota bacterium]
MPTEDDGPGNPGEPEDRAETAGAGRIVLVGTPIGNLGDLSPRAVRVLAAADVIACEDTRVTRKLLTHAGITGRRLVALHAHNEASAAAALVSEASAGAVVAVVTDAGMPGISDPGARLVAAAAATGVEVEVVPGPSAALAALVVSGLPTDRFSFDGFLPRKGGERAARLAAIAAEPRTVVLFESPHRVRVTVGNLLSSCGADRSVAIARELTKRHQEVWRGSLGEAGTWLETVAPRGEYVIVVGPARPPDPAGAATAVDDDAITSALVSRLAAGDDRKAAVAGVAASLGVPRRRVYDVAVALKKARGQQEAAR